MPLLTFTCAHCGVVTSREYRGSGPRPSLCGNACKVAAWKARHPDRILAAAEHAKAQTAAAAAARSCRCGKPLGLWQRLWCSRICERLAASKPKQCRSCGAHVDKHQQRCSSCRDQSAAVVRQAARRSPSARAAKARRRAMTRGSLPGAERFDPVAVLVRDGWRCHLCGMRTPQRLRGTCHDRAPELDHIVPIAAGGEHTMTNTACACRQCNLAKGARPLGQLRLLA